VLAAEDRIYSARQLVDVAPLLVEALSEVIGLAGTWPALLRHLVSPQRLVYPALLAATSSRSTGFPALPSSVRRNRSRPRVAPSLPGRNRRPATCLLPGLVNL